MTIEQDDELMTKACFADTLQRLVEPRVAWEKSTAEQISILQTRESINRREIERLKDEIFNLEMKLQNNGCNSEKPKNLSVLGSLMAKIFDKK